MLASAFAVLAAAVAVSAQSTITVNTPSAPVFCQPTLLSWSGGTAPYFVNMNVGGSISEVIEVILTSTTATSYTWITDIAAGTSVTLAVKDSTGASNYAAQVTIGANPQGLTTCAGAASSNVNSASVENTVSATVSQASTTLVGNSLTSAAAGAASSTTAAASSSAAATSAAASSSRTTGAASSVAGRASSAVGGASSTVAGVVGSASAAVASASQAVTGAASTVYGASLLTVLAAGGVALFAL